MSALLRFKLPHHCLSIHGPGKHYKGQEALANHMVDAVADSEECTFKLTKQLSNSLQRKLARILE